MITKEILLPSTPRCPIKDQVIDENWDQWPEYHDVQKYDRERPQKLLTEIFKEVGIVESLDFIPLMSARDDRVEFFFKRDLHCTVEGNRFIGEKTAEFILG